MKTSRQLRRALRLATTRWRRGRRGSSETTYKSQQEIALENAAESLGVTLGEYYPESVERSDLPFDVDMKAGARVDASREELLAYIDGLRGKRRRRARVRRLRATAAVVGLGLLAIAVTLLSIGNSREGPGNGVPRHRAASSLVNSVQAPMGTSASSKLSDGGGKLINSTYFNRDGDICSALIEFRDGISERNTVDGCVSPDRIATNFRREAAFVTAMSTLKQGTVIRGYARVDVERIGGTSVWGRVEAAVSAPWAPGIGDPVRSMSVKAFLAIVRRRSDRGRESGDPLRGSLNSRSYHLTARLRDGHVVAIRFGPSGSSPARDSLIDPIVQNLGSDGGEDQHHRFE